MNSFSGYLHNALCVNCYSIYINRMSDSYTLELLDTCIQLHIIIVLTRVFLVFHRLWQVCWRLLNLNRNIACQQLIGCMYPMCVCDVFTVLWLCPCVCVCDFVYQAISGSVLHVKWMIFFPTHHLFTATYILSASLE